MSLKKKSALAQHAYQFGVPVDGDTIGDFAIGDSIVISSKNLTSLNGTAASGTIDLGGLEGVDAVVHLAGAGIGVAGYPPALSALVVGSLSATMACVGQMSMQRVQVPQCSVAGSSTGSGRSV